MRDDDQELLEILQYLSEEKVLPWDGHPAIEVLMAYRASELTPEESERLIDHFVVCPDCVALYFDQDSFFDPDDGAGGAAEVADIRSGSDWPVLRARLFEELPDLKVPRGWLDRWLFAHRYAA